MASGYQYSRTSGTGSYNYYEELDKSYGKKEDTTILLDIHVWPGLAVITNRDAEDVVFHRTSYGAFNPDPNLGDRIQRELLILCKELPSKIGQSKVYENQICSVTSAFAIAFKSQKGMWQLSELNHLIAETWEEHHHGVEAVQGCTRYSKLETEDD